MHFISIRALMVLLLFLSLAAWAMSSAVGSTQDEDFILTSIWCGTSESVGATPYCQPDPDRQGSMIVPGLVADPEVCLFKLAAGSFASAGCQEGLRDEVFSTNRYSKGSYPENYSDVMRNFVSADVETSVMQMRLFNSFLAAVTIILAFSINLRPLNDSHLTWMIVITPMAAYFIGSVHNSSWTLIGTTCFIFAFTSLLRHRKVPRIWIPASMLVLFAVWLSISSRPEGGYTLIILTAIMLISEFPPKGLKLSKKNLIIVGATLTIGTFIYQRTQFWGNTNFFGSQAVSPESDSVSANDLILHNFLGLPSFFTSFFGSVGFGDAQVKLSPTIWLFSLQATLMLMVFAIRKSHKMNRITYAFSFSFLIFITLFTNQTATMYDHHGGRVESSSRYFMPLFIGIVVVIANNKKSQYPIALVISVALMSTISNSLAIRDTIRRYVTGQDIYSTKSLNNGREWWWNFGPAPETVWLIGSMAFAMLFAVIIYERKRESAETASI